MKKQKTILGQCTAGLLAVTLGFTLIPATLAHAEEPGAATLPLNGTVPAQDGASEDDGTEEGTKPADTGAVDHGSAGDDDGTALDLTPIFPPLAPQMLSDGLSLLAAPNLSVAISVISDGTAAWDETGFDPATGANAGDDDGAHNGIVRVNDTVRYQLQYGSAGTQAENATFTVKFPKGMVLQGSLPLYCIGPDSSLTPETVTPSLPITADTMSELPEQTLVCNVGTMQAGTAFEIFDVKVLNATHNNTVLPILETSFTADELDSPVQASSLPEVTATARLKWDISKNGMHEPANSGHGGTLTFAACQFDPTRYCYQNQFSVLLSAPVEGKGAMPPVGDVTFVDDVSAATLYTDLDADQIAAIEADLETYGTRVMVVNENSIVANPNSRVTGANTTVNSVRNSGTLTVDQPGPGKPAAVTLSGVDWSLATFPSESRNGTAVPAGAAYAVSRSLRIEIPSETVQQFGVPTGSSKQLRIDNVYTELYVTGFNPAEGDVLTSAEQPTWNDSRESQATISTGLGGGVGKNFVGVAGAAGNLTELDFTSSLGSPQGPPGDATSGSGEIIVTEAQEVVSLLHVQGSHIENPGVLSIVACDAWDNTRLHLRADHNTGVTTGSYGLAQRVASNGSAVWVSGYNNVPNPPAASSRWAASADETPAITVQYSGSGGDAGNGAASRCENSQGPWYDSPDHPDLDNDPALAADGVYTGVNRVRVHLVLPEPWNRNVGATGRVSAFVSVGMRVAEAGNPAGDILPNWVSYKRVDGEAVNLDAVLAAPSTWVNSSYVPGTHSGQRGDRLKLGTVIVRVDKQVRRLADDGAFQKTTTLPVLAGDLVQYRLSPTLTSPAQAAVTHDIWVEDCLPPEHSFISADGLPDGTQFTLSADAPSDAKRAACAPGETYLRWVLPDMSVNTVIEPIIVTVDVSQAAPSGAYLNTVEVWTDGDPSLATSRQSEAGVQLTARASMQITKTALTPVVQVNPVGNEVLELNRWAVKLRNAQPESAPPVSDPDVIDVLPANGVNGSAFDGTFALASVTGVTAGATVLYSASDQANVDPHDASNGATGSTAWCDAPSGGNLVSGIGACPESITQVTALRVQKPGAFATGSEISFEIAMVAEGNAAGDVYGNQVSARAIGFEFPVGPIVRSERAEASSVGDYVWWDLNRDGIQNDFAGNAEPPASGVTVHLTGFDDLGNPLSLETTTGADGSYVFDNLRGSDADGYTISFIAPAGASFTGQGSGSDTSLDSDVDPSTGETVAVLGRNSQDPTIDAGLLAHGALQVQKLTEGVGAGSVSIGDQLVFDVQCTFDGETVYSNDSLVLTIGADASGVTSDEIGPLPVFSECTVTETSTENADDVATPSAVTVPWNGAEQSGGIANALLTNYYSAGTLTVSKAVEGEPAALETMTDFEYEVLVTCQVAGSGAPVDILSQSLTLTGGESAVLSDVDGSPVLLPVGARCFAQETEDGGAASVGIDHDSFENAVEVVAGSPDELQALEITVTNRFELPEGTLVIHKLLEGVGVEPFSAEDEFSFQVVCTYEGTEVLHENIVIAAGGNTAVASDPIGPLPATTSCVITETDASSSDEAAVPVTVMIPWNADEWASGEVVASLTNYYSAGTITLEKQLEGNETALEAAAEREFEILLTCQIDENGVPTDLHSQLVTFTGAGSRELLDDAGSPVLLPLGAKCFAEETESGGATDVQIEHNSFENGAEVTAGSPDELQTLRVSVVNTFELPEAQLVISKAFEGQGAGYFASGNELVFDLVCTFEGETIYDERVTLTVPAGATPLVSDPFGPFPATTSCTVTEVGAGSADTVAEPVTVLLPWNPVTWETAEAVASLTNHYSAGTVAINKQLEGDDAALIAAAELDFEILVICQLEEGGALVDLHTQLVTFTGSGKQQLRDAEGHAVVLPLGAKCFAEEIEDGGAAAVVIDHDSFETGVEVVGGAPEELQSLEITVTNRFELPVGTLVINKILEGVGVHTHASADEFVFSVVCTYNGEVNFEETVTLSADGGATITSNAFGPFPATTSCTVTEVGAGSADTAAEPVTVMVPWNPVTWESGELVASLTNYYSAGTIAVSKQLEGDAAAVEYMTDAVFEIQVTCQIEEKLENGDVTRVTLYQGAVKIKGGQTKMLVNAENEPEALPVGARCFAEETLDGGATATTISAGTFEEGVEVRSGTPDELQQLRIDVTNHFECTDAICGNDEPGAGEPGTDEPDAQEPPTSTDALPMTGAQVSGAFAAIAGLVLLTAGGLLMLRRRRESALD